MGRFLDEIKTKLVIARDILAVLCGIMLYAAPFQSYIILIFQVQEVITVFLLELQDKTD